MRDLLRGVKVLAKAFVRAYRLHSQAVQAKAEGNEMALRRVKRAIEDARAETLGALRGDDHVEARRFVN